jgi:hypothetical protein
MLVPLDVKLKICYIVRILLLCALADLCDLVQAPCAAEISINADAVFPQMVAINRGDFVRWTTVARIEMAVLSYSGQYALILSKTNNWSAAYRFDTPGTNFYQIGLRSGIVIVHDWTSQPAAITINTPLDGSVYN